MHVQLKLCLSRAKADTAALQQELKVFHAAEHRLKSLNLDHYQDGVLERIAQAVLKGNLDRTMDTHMLVSLAHNANLDASSKQRHATLYSQKRPTIEAKETYYTGKRDLLYRQKRPTILLV
jgi:hypothetical protein